MQMAMEGKNERGGPLRLNFRDKGTHFGGLRKQLLEDVARF